MPKKYKLVVIESPGKSAKISSILGNDYKVTSTRGHCVDLPLKKIGVDIKKDFCPTFEILPDKQDTINEIIQLSKDAELVYIFTDKDSEGAAIGRHIADRLPKGIIIKRIKTDSITKSAIENAINNPTTMDEDLPLIEAQLTRRILDRLAGWKYSFLTFQSTGGKSCGRVQSALLRIIVEREQDILAFIPEEYWVLTAHLSSSKHEPFTGILSEKIKVPDEKTATEIYEKVIKGTPVITSVEAKEVDSNPYPPFTTLPMLSTASSVLGWSSDKTTKIAQDLYSSGKISYIRTDSPYIPPEMVCSMRDRIDSDFGECYLTEKPRFYSAKAGAQEAHSAVHPTDINANHALSGDEKKLYDLIWKRAVASQMASGRDRRLKVITTIGGYEFVSNGNIRLFDGYRRVWTYGKSEDVILPELKEGEQCILRELERQQKFTQPPSRYTESSLPKIAEKLQITRPATYARSVGTLKDRGYIKATKSSFCPTEVGIKVVDFLKAANVCFIDLQFTCDLENLLDQIQEGKTTRLQVLTDFWNRLKQDIENGKKIKAEAQLTSYKCPLCGAFLLRKNSRFGPFFSCQNYKPAKKEKPAKETKTKKKTVKKKDPKPENTTPGCSYIATVGPSGEPIEKVKKELIESEFKCCSCNEKLIVRTSKKGNSYLGCRNWNKNADCKGFWTSEGEKMEFTKKKWGKRKKDESSSNS